MAHTRHITDLEIIVAVKVMRDLNLADIGTHYCTRDILDYFRYKTRNM